LAMAKIIAENILIEKEKVLIIGQFISVKLNLFRRSLKNLLNFGKME